MSNEVSETQQLANAVIKLTLELQRLNNYLASNKPIQVEVPKEVRIKSA